MSTPSMSIVALLLAFTLAATTVQPSDAIRVLKQATSMNADAVAKPTALPAGEQLTFGFPFPPIFPFPGAPGFPFPSFPPVFPLPGAPRLPFLPPLPAFPGFPRPGTPLLPPIPSFPHPPPSSTSLSAQISTTSASSSSMGLMHDGTAGPVLLPPLSSPATAPSPAPSPYK